VKNVNHSFQVTPSSADHRHHHRRNLAITFQKADKIRHHLPSALILVQPSWKNSIRHKPVKDNWFAKGDTLGVCILTSQTTMETYLRVVNHFWTHDYSPTDAQPNRAHWIITWITIILIYRTRKDGRLSWPTCSWLAHSRHFTHKAVNHRAGAGPGKSADQRPTS